MMFWPRETVIQTMTAQFSVYIRQTETATSSSTQKRFNSRQKSASFWDSFSPQMAWLQIKRKLMLSGQYVFQSVKGTWELPKHGELPEALLQPSYTIGRTTKRASEELHTMVLGHQDRMRSSAIKGELTKTPLLAYFGQRQTISYKTMDPWRA